ncbi:NUDIX hydrolase [Alteribacter natronophilus]|uniref:NUDIX hydrolase n=1 Tax=Alteribacter natronophilus TaxID=2583810 RepID=UPI00110E5A4E|nr:NUDIX domain-containing protein [Alteribacter natronophilus]TMW70090.1 NUDIX domain-containing protein [Alteribacter natronophilus]
MEKWDIYDRHRRKTGKQMIRGEAFEDGAYHLVVHVCLFNEKGEMLIQQRQSDRETWADMWDVTVGGSALAGETSQEAAEREVEEEIGYTLDFSSRRPSFTINFDHGFDDYYLVESQVDISSLTFPTEEVKEVMWASRQEIMDMIEEGVFIPYYESLIQLFFDIRHGLGAHDR